MVDCFANGTYQLADLDGAPHVSRVNGLQLKIDHARLTMVEKDAMSEEETMPFKNVETCDAASLMSLFAVADHE